MTERKPPPISPHSGKIAPASSKKGEPLKSPTSSAKAPPSPTPTAKQPSTSPRSAPPKTPPPSQPPKSPSPPKNDDDGWDDEERTTSSPKIQYELAEVIADYIPEKPQEHLTLLKYDRVYVMKKGSDGWWEGECNGIYGKFPAKHVKLLKDKVAQEKKKGANVW